jgi:hypothetical protein
LPQSVCSPSAGCGLVFWLHHSAPDVEVAVPADGNNHSGHGLLLRRPDRLTFGELVVAVANLVEVVDPPRITNNSPDQPEIQPPPTPRPERLQGHRLPIPCRHQSQTPAAPAAAHDCRTADAVLSKNGVPPSPPEETWGQAIPALGAVAWRTARRGFELFGEALIAVASPLLTAAVDGLGMLVAAITVYELWRPAEALADAFVAWCGR